MTALCVATSVGCSNRIVGNNITQANTWQGELGITGHLNNITIKNGSNITKLSVIGDANKVHVEDRVTLGKVEVWGQRNKIYIPDYLVIRESIVGNGSEVVRVHPGIDEPFESAFPPEPPLASDTTAPTPTTTESAGTLTLEN
ncbi:MAG: hypothetical protein D6744_14750, partial [Planctomycetota bacterium]